MVIDVPDSTGTIDPLRLASDRSNPTRAIFRDTRGARLCQRRLGHADLRQADLREPTLADTKQRLADLAERFA